MSDTKTRSYRLDAKEKKTLEHDGFVVRERAFSPRECKTIAEDCEALGA